MGLLLRVLCLGVLVYVAQRPRPAPAVSLENGDVVFQTSTSARSALIRKASGSPYSHVGLIEVAADGTFVIEAIEPVSRTPWAQWRDRGVDQHVTVIRAKKASVAERAKVVRTAKSWLGRHYDARYRWDDERLYCSELVTKAYATVGIEAGERVSLQSLHLSQEELATASSLGIDPKQQLVTPASIASDDDFAVVFTSFDPHRSP